MDYEGKHVLHSLYCFSFFSYRYFEEVIVFDLLLYQPQSLFESYEGKNTTLNSSLISKQ